jgi:predicted nucleic acid-binding Zn ribbon protein
MKKDLQTTSNKNNLNPSGKGVVDLMNLNLGSLTGASLGRLFNQLVIFILDGSGSMTWTGTSGKSKAEEVSLVTNNVIERLTKSRNKDCFDVIGYAFAVDTKKMIPVTSAEEVRLGHDFNPCNYIEDYRSTCASEAFRQTEKDIESYFNKHASAGIKTRAIVVLLSDGQLHDHAETSAITKRMLVTNKVDVCCTYFADADSSSSEDESLSQEMLRELSSLELMYASTMNADDIRDHMVKSISLSSGVPL